MAAVRKKGAKAVARSYFEAVRKRDLDAMVAHYAPDGSGRIYGVVELTIPHTYREWFENLFRAFPDFEMEILDIVGSGELAAVRWRATGTFTGPARFEGMSPTGAPVETEGCDMLTIRDELIHENQAYMNESDLARQLGALPPSGSIAERGLVTALNARTAAGKGIQKLRERR